MDPLTSLGLVGNLIQIISFASNIGIETSKLLKSSNQSLPENQWLQTQAQRSEVLTAALCPPGSDGRNASIEEATMLTLAKSCQDEASKLIALLNTLELTVRPGGSKSKLLAVKQVVRSKMWAGDIEASRKRLEAVERQLTYAVVSSIAKSQVEEFGNIKRILSEDGAGRKVSNNTLERVENEVHRTKRDLEDAREHKLAKKVIRTLDFPQRTHRVEAIEDRHWTTFHWVLSEGTFKNWLDGSDKLFWICGHPGSGKSTLTKYLAQSLSTAASIKDSMSGTEVLIASHFFWVAGHPWQKSILGMLQGLLFQLLSSLPSLTKIAFPSPWGSILAGKTKSTGPWTKDELFDAFQHIGLFADVQMVLLVDGLDECDERNHPDLLRVIRQLASIEKIRICLSSRPWPVFEREFGRSTPNLLLQSLTWIDMYNYTCTRLQSTDPTLGLDATTCKTSDEQFDLVRQIEAKELVQSLVDKADGVFFWLSLVLDTLCVRLLDGHSLQQLQRFVREFPPKLEDYFEKLVYERIAETYRSATFSETAMALRIALMGKSADDVDIYRGYIIGGNMHFLHFWVLRESILNEGDITVDPHFGTHAKFRKFTEDELQTMLEDTNKYIVSCCKDFLHIPHHRDEEGERLDAQVAFRHRTAHDFLYTQRMQDLINHHVPPHFLHEDMWWKQMTLCRLKIQYSDLSDIYRYLMTDASRYLDDRYKPYQAEPGFEHYYLDWMDVLGSHTEIDALCYFEREEPDDTTQLISLSIEYGCHKFAARVINVAQFSPLCRSTKRHLLLAVACGLRQMHMPLETVKTSTVSLLLRLDADPNAVFEGIEDEHRPNASIWQRLLLKMWAETYARPTWDTGIERLDSDEAEYDETAIRYDLVKLMIEYGADVNALVCILTGDCHYQGHGPRCPADKCSGHDGHELMYVKDIIYKILTPADAIEIHRLIAHYSSTAVAEELRSTRRSRISQKIHRLLAAQKRELLAGLVRANRDDSEFVVVYNEVIASGAIGKHEERSSRSTERWLEDVG